METQDAGHMEKHTLSECVSEFGVFLKCFLLRDDHLIETRGEKKAMNQSTGAPKG